MSKYEVHCLECKKLLGDEFGYVHKWLDEYFMYPKYKTHHRKLRHHKAGIKAVKAKWGIRASWAAEIHIKRDLKEDGYDCSQNPIPKNRKEYEKLGLW